MTMSRNAGATRPTQKTRKDDHPYHPIMIAGTKPMSDPDKTIAFQGSPGAYSDLACRSVRPEMKTLPCHDFEGTFAAVHEGRAALAVIPIDN